MSTAGWVLYLWGLVIIWRIVSKWRRPWRLQEAFKKPSRGLREAFAERVFEKASRSLQGASSNPSRRFTNPSRRLHIPKTPRRRLGGFTGPPRRVRGWTACSYSIMTVIMFGLYYTVFRTVDSSFLKKVARPLLLRPPKVVFFGAQAEKNRLLFYFIRAASLWCSAAK